MNSRRLTPNERAAIIEARRTGKFVKQIAFEFACHESTVRRVCQQAGVWRPYSANKQSVKARRWYARNRDKVLLKRLARKGMGHGQAGEGNLDARQVGDLAL